MKLMISVAGGILLIIDDNRRLTKKKRWKLTLGASSIHLVSFSPFVNYFLQYLLGNLFPRISERGQLSSYFIIISPDFESSNKKTAPCLHISIRVLILFFSYFGDLSLTLLGDVRHHTKIQNKRGRFLYFLPFYFPSNVEMRCFTLCYYNNSSNFVSL